MTTEGFKVIFGEAEYDTAGFKVIFGNAEYEKPKVMKRRPLSEARFELYYLLPL